MATRRPFWHFEGFSSDEPEDAAERDLWQKRLQRLRRMNSLPRAVASARRLVRIEYLRNAERRRRRGGGTSLLSPARGIGAGRRGATAAREPRPVVIVTTAAPPWLTGTSVNPLCRAIALARRGLGVTIFFPWLEPANQAELFAAGVSFATKMEQERWIRTHFDCKNIEILFYRAHYHPALRSILPTRSVMNWVPPSELLILEEPEHLLAPHPWQKLTEKSLYIVGIVHTHYLYLISLYLGKRVMTMAEPPLRATLPRVVRRNCNQTICLSRTIEGYEGAIFENVNGVRDEFFLPNIVESAADDAPSTGLSTAPATPLYFIGKLIWEKGFHEMVDLLAAEPVQNRVVDVWGGGDDRDEILAYASEQSVRLNLCGQSVRPSHDLRSYRVFVNPSTSEVLCTTTAEALAMGKWAIVPRHVSNEFFYAFPNCLVYETPAEFRNCLHRALSEDAPTGLRDALTWDAATERLLRLLQN